MPIYAYKCQQCAHEFDLLVKLGAPLPACPKCAGDVGKKLTAPGGFDLKGGGYYATDFKGK